MVWQETTTEDGLASSSISETSPPDITATTALSMLNSSHLRFLRQWRPSDMDVDGVKDLASLAVQATSSRLVSSHLQSSKREAPSIPNSELSSQNFTQHPGEL
jgi:hypothetical protein